LSGFGEIIADKKIVKRKTYYTSRITS